MANINVKINGIEVSVPVGTTILDAAQLKGIACQILAEVQCLAVPAASLGTIYAQIAHSAGEGDDIIGGLVYCRVHALEGIGHIGLASVAVSAGSDGLSAALTVEHKCRIFGNLETVIPEPLTDLCGVYAARFGNLRDADTLMIPDVLLNLLELGFDCFPAIRANYRSGDIVEHLTAASAILNIHPLDLPSYTPVPDATVMQNTFSAPASKSALEQASIVDPVV